MVNTAERVMVVGAGWDQTPIIREAKRQGHFVVALDADPEAYGLQFADVALTISTRDSEGVLAAARTHRVDALTYMITESPLFAIRYAADVLNLPAPSHKAVEATVSKPRMREIFGAYGIPNPGYGHATSLSEAQRAARLIGFPLVIKSADVGGQLGLYLLRTEADLERRFEESRSLSVNGQVILEQYLEGPEVNVVAIVTAGLIRVLTISDRIKDQHKGFGVVMRHLYPAAIESAAAQAIATLCQQAVDAMELEDGIIFPQIIVTSRGPVIVEIGVRIPGGVMKELFEYATGFDLVRLQLDISLGKAIELEDYRVATGYPAVTVKFVNGDPGPLRPGRVSRILNHHEALSIEGVVEAQYYNDPSRPQEIRPLGTGRDRFYYIVSVGDTPRAVVESSDKAAVLLDFLDESGESLKLRPL